MPTTYPAFLAVIEDAFLDEEVNARGELSPRQRDAVMAEVQSGPVDLTLRRVRGAALGCDPPPQKVFVAHAPAIPVRQGLTLLMAEFEYQYECFVTKRPELVVGITRPTITPREIVERYRKSLLDRQEVTEVDVEANAEGTLSAAQRRRRAALTVKFCACLLLLLSIPVAFWVPTPLMIGADVIFVPLPLFGLYWLIRTWLLETRSAVLVTEGRVTAMRPFTRNSLQSVAIGDFEFSPGANRLLDLVLRGLPYRFYWTAYPSRPRRKNAPLRKDAPLRPLAPDPYRSGSEPDSAPEQRPKLLSFIAIDLSEQPLGQ